MAAPASSWSLARRLTGGAVLVALLAFVAQVLVLDFWIRPLLDELAAATAAHSSSIRTALAAVPAAQRPALAQSLSGESVRVASAAPASAAQATDDVLGTEFVRRLRAHLGRSVLVRAGDGPAPGADVEVGVSVDGQTWWIDFSQPAQEAAVLDTLVIWLAVLAIVALAAVLLSVRFVTRPLGRLAQQIGSRGSQVVPIEPDPHSSAELQRIVAAFNDLARTVEQAHSMRQQLLAGVSHDLRTPLARLRLRVETQCEPELADKIAADLRSIEHIVNQFLAYVQGSQAPIGGRLAPLATTLAAVVADYAAQGAAVSVHIEVAGPDLPDLAIQRLVGNLVDNALAYGRAPLRVELLAEAGACRLRVVDQGPGMSDEEFGRARQPFVRLASARSDLGHCGLGLAIATQIAQQIGAELWPSRTADGFAIELRIPRPT